MKSIEDLKKILDDAVKPIKGIDVDKITKDLKRDVLNRCDTKEEKNDFIQAVKQAEDIGRTGDVTKMADLQRKFNDKKNGSNSAI